MYKFKKITKDKIKGNFRGGENRMIKQIAWNTFKNTGNIDTFLEYTQLKDIENNIRIEENGNYKNKGNNNC